MIMTPVDSQKIDQIGYDFQSETLRVEFYSGKIIDYLRVPKGTYESFRDTTYVDQFYYHLIERRYNFCDMDQQ